ncbi:type IX secretion system membrane protein PorP/SprF, partial [Arthrospira platensis SPKY1]|nr:type IX secretion system membrane protein PorP/SprF [Arthrospira platensis SPKY1]
PFDPIIGGIYQKDNYFNVDLGMSYFYLDFFAHFTVKNAIANIRRELYTEFESDNLRKYIASAGHVFGDSERILWEPSVMFQFTEQTQEKAIDLNMKVYKDLNFGRIWGGLSYRTSFDGAQFVDGSSISDQRLQYITPILGL